MITAILITILPQKEPAKANLQSFAGFSGWYKNKVSYIDLDTWWNAIGQPQAGITFTSTNGSTMNFMKNINNSSTEHTFYLENTWSDKSEYYCHMMNDFLEAVYGTSTAEDVIYLDGTPNYRLTKIMKARGYYLAPDYAISHSAVGGRYQTSYHGAFLERLYTLQPSTLKQYNGYDYSKSLSALFMLPVMYCGSYAGVKEFSGELTEANIKAYIAGNDYKFLYDDNRSDSTKPFWRVKDNNHEVKFTFDKNVNNETAEARYYVYSGYVRNAGASTTDSVTDNLYEYHHSRYLSYLESAFGTSFKSLADIEKAKNSGVVTGDYSISVKEYTLGVIAKTQTGDPQVSSTPTPTPEVDVSTLKTSSWKIIKTSNSSLDSMDSGLGCGTEADLGFVFYDYAVDTANSNRQVKISQWDNLGTFLDVLWLDDYFVCANVSPSGATTYLTWYLGRDNDNLYFAPIDMETQLGTSTIFGSECYSSNYKCIKIPKEKLTYIRGIGMIKADGDGDGLPTPRNGSGGYMPDIDADKLVDLAGGASAIDPMNAGMFTSLVPEWRTQNNLLEQDLSGLLGKRDDLKQKDLGNLSDWEAAVNTGDPLVNIIRVATQILGVLMLVWTILLYLAYWFDKLNTFVEFSILSVLTVGKLMVSDDEDECTFNKKGHRGVKTVNHKTILMICLISMFFSILIITGGLYRFLAWLIFKIKGIFS